MIKYGTKTINQKMTIGENEYDISIKVLHNSDTPQATQITIKVNDKNSLFYMEASGIDLSEAHTALNEIMCAFRTLTGLPMATVGAGSVLVPASAVDSIYNR
jgi:hypothetical protein